MTVNDQSVNPESIDLSEYENGVSSRLSIALLHRKPYAWAADVLLSRGAIGRLQKGNLPDAVKLLPAVRIERLSLTWLLDGRGPPYSVNHAISDDDTWKQVSMRITDEPDAWSIYIATSAEGWAVVLAQDCINTSDSGKEYTWRATEVWGGACGPLTAKRLLSWASVKPIEQITLSAADWRRLVTGHLGNAELWGARGVKSVAKIHPVGDIHTITDLRLQKVAEPTTDPSYQQVLRHLQKMSPEDRSTIAIVAQRLVTPPSDENPK